MRCIGPVVGPRALFVGTLIASAAAIGIAITAIGHDGRAVNCYEDEVIMWSGETNDHTICMPLDDLIGPPTMRAY